MVFHADAVARVQAAAFNAQDMDTFANQVGRQARVLRDGFLIGEGRGALHKGITAEYQEGRFAQAARLDGEAVVAEFQGDPEHPQYLGVIRSHHIGDLVDEVRIDHDPVLLRRLQA